MSDIKTKTNRIGRTYETQGNVARQAQNGPVRVRQPESTNESQQREQPKHVVRKGMDIDFVTAAVLLIALFGALYAGLRFLDLSTQLRETEKTIVASESQLADMVSNNNAAQTVFEEAIDFEYVYGAAVVKLGMVFPNNNTTVYYDMQPDEYVRHLREMPKVEVADILDILIGR